MTVILGISAYYHDSAATLLIDGEIFAAVQEERFTRIKHDNSFPANSIKYVLTEAKLDINDVNHIVFYEKPFLKFERLIETYIAMVPKGYNQFRISMPSWIQNKLFLKKIILKELKNLGLIKNDTNILFNKHHMSHAASAFYPSPFNEAIVLTIDAVGEWATTSISIGKGSELKTIKELNFPHSLGLLYSAFTYYLGFKVNSGEYKVMGLAPYGKPKYHNLILNNLVDLKDDGSFKLNQSYFNYATGLTMISKKFVKLFGQKVRKYEVGNLTQFHMDIAASIQSVTEEIILTMTKYISKEFKIQNLCLAGGVALNCVANGKILKQKTFKNIWIQPAAGDAGGSLGSCLSVWYLKLKNKRRNLKINELDHMKGAYLGPSFSEHEIDSFFRNLDIFYHKLNDIELYNYIAIKLSEGHSVGWFQGRMEFGPRALGNRSILADPRSDMMQKNLNLKVKFRESFRPFAPAIIYEDAKDWFKIKTSSSYMLFVDQVKDEHKIYDKKNKLKKGLDQINNKRSTIPAVTHVDYSARIQTVHKETNERFYKLLKKFKEKTGCPMLVNTSFNIRGEPIVCSPKDAYNCFMGTGLDILVIDNFMVLKNEQKSKNIHDYQKQFKLD
jgi:carbamoyltransferase